MFRDVPVVQKLIDDYFTADLKEQLVSKRHLYLEMWNDVYSGKITDKGFVTLDERNKLYNTMSTTHAFIPNGYYDLKRKGVPFVKDIDSGKMIQRHLAVLLPTGQFIHQKSKKLLQNSAETKRRLYKAFNLGDKKEIASLKDCWIYLNAYSTYVPTIKGVLTLGATSEMYIKILKHRFAVFILETFYFTSGQNHRPFPKKLIDQAMYEYAKEKINMDFNEVFKMYEQTTLPFKVLLLGKEGTLSLEQYDFGKGWTISAESILVRHLERKSLSGGLDAIQNKDVLICLSAHKFIGDSGQHRMLREHQLSSSFNRIMHTFRDVGVSANTFIDLCFFETKTTATKRIDDGTPKIEVGENRDTQNSEGSIMNYTSKVPKYKKSFMVTDREKELLNIKSFKPSIKDPVAKRAMDTTQILIDMHKAGVMNSTKLTNFLTKDERAVKISSSVKQVNMPIFLGVEIELVPKSKDMSGQVAMIQKIARSPLGNHILMKSDTSIGNYGFEIVTVPATLEYHRKMFEDNFFGKGKYNFAKELMSTTRCGIHVHVDKKAFTRLSLGKFMSFINSKQNTAFIDDFAGRTENGFCKRMPLSGTNSKGIDTSAKIGRQVNMNARSDNLPRGAVNLQTTDMTVELRLFKASSSKNNVIRKIEFCDALTRFVRQGESSIQHMTVHHFVEFILRKENKANYPCTLRWLATKNYVQHERKRVKGVSRLIHTYSKNLVPKPVQKILITNT